MILGSTSWRGRDWLRRPSDVRHEACNAILAIGTLESIGTFFMHSSIAPTCLCCSALAAFYLKRKHQSGSMRWRVLEVYAECSSRILVCFRTLSSSVLDHFFTISAFLTSWLQDWGNWDEFGWSTDPAASSGSDEVQELQFLKTS